jgi:hypothetical protein
MLQVTKHINPVLIQSTSRRDEASLMKTGVIWMGQSDSAMRDDLINLTCLIVVYPLDPELGSFSDRVSQGGKSDTFSPNYSRFRSRISQHAFVGFDRHYCSHSYRKSTHPVVALIELYTDDQWDNQHLTCASTCFRHYKSSGTIVCCNFAFSHGKWVNGILA